MKCTVFQIFAAGLTEFRRDFLVCIDISFFLLYFFIIEKILL